MPIYDGVVTVAEADIPVIVELDDDVVRLSASGTEIGHWPKNECEIRHLGNATYAIEAEDETLSFVPSQPSLFAAAVNGDPKARHAAPPPAGPTPPPVTQREVSEAPPAKAATMGFFYALCLLTAGLAVWSIFSLIF